MYVTLRRPTAPPAPAPDPALDPALGSAPGAARRRVPATVWALGLVSFWTDLSSESVASILPLYVTTVLGMGPFAYGIVDGIQQGGSAAVRLLGGWWADTSRHPKRVAVVGYALSAVSRVALLPVTGFGWVSAVIAADRIGKGLRTGPRDAMIVTASASADLGRSFGVHRTLDTAGALVGPLFAFAVLAAVPAGLGGYHSVFVGSVAAAVIGLAVLLLAVPDAAPVGGQPLNPPHPPERARLGSAVRDPEVRRLLVAAGLLGGVTVGDGFLYLALAQVGGIGSTSFPLLLVGTNAAYLVLAAPAGLLADRWGRGRVFLAGHVLLLGAYALTASTPLTAGGPVSALLVLVLLGAFYAATDGVLAALAGALLPETGRATGISAAQTVTALSRFGCSLGFGVLWQLTDQTTAFAVAAGALGLVLPGVFALLRSTPVDRRERA